MTKEEIQSLSDVELVEMLKDHAVGNEHGHETQLDELTEEVLRRLNWWSEKR